MNYRDCKIYKVLNNIADDVYVGDTCQRLAKRMMNHRTRMKDGKETARYNQMRELGSENFYIELIEEHPCVNYEQSLKRAGEWIRQIANFKIAGRTKEEYRDQRKGGKMKKEETDTT